jgi:hypothetical protein
MTVRMTTLVVVLISALQVPHSFAVEVTEGPKLEADGWLLNAAIECGNAEQLKRVDQSHFSLAPREDPLPIEVQKTGPISN